MPCIEYAFHPTFNIHSTAHSHHLTDALYAFCIMHHVLHVSCILCIIHCMHQAQLYTSCTYYTGILLSAIYFWNSLRTNQPTDRLTDIATYRATIAEKNILDRSKRCTYSTGKRGGRWCWRLKILPSITDRKYMYDCKAFKEFIWEYSIHEKSIQITIANS